MKTKLIWVLRYIIIPFAFAQATGLPGKIASIDFSSKGSDATHTFTKEELATLEVHPSNFRTYYDSLEAVRKQEIKKTGKYDVYTYFYDLKQSHMFEVMYRDSLDKSPNTRGILLSLFSTRNMFVGMRDENWRSYADINRAKIDEARGYWFPKEKEKDIARAKQPPMSWWDDFFKPILMWFIGFYFKGLPIAFVLFLIWKLNLKKDFDEEFRWEKVKPEMQFAFAPGSFLFSVLIWPIVLGIDIRNRFNEFLKKADVISRRNSLFTLFSKQEQQLLEFGKRMTTREFSEHLDSVNMKRKHSFVNALCVTLFLIIVPTSLFPQKATKNFSKENVIMMKSDYGGGGIHYDVLAKSSAVLNYGDDVKQFPEFTKLIFYITDWLYEYVFVPDIGKVPLVVNRVLVTLI